MSTATVFAITCDEPGCEEEYVGSVGDTEDIARDKAQGNHWGEWSDTAKRRRFDLCPDHKPTT